jgi:hypothetical protein
LFSRGVRNRKGQETQGKGGREPKKKGSRHLHSKEMEESTANIKQEGQEKRARKINEAATQEAEINEELAHHKQIEKSCKYKNRKDRKIRGREELKRAEPRETEISEELAH